MDLLTALLQISANWYASSIFHGFSEALPQTDQKKHNCSQKYLDNVKLASCVFSFFVLWLVSSGGFASRRATSVVLGPAATNPDHDEHGHGTGESANVFAVAPNVNFTMVKINFVIIEAKNADLEKGFSQLSCMLQSYNFMTQRRKFCNLVTSRNLVIVGRFLGRVGLYWIPLLSTKFYVVKHTNELGSFSQECPTFRQSNPTFAITNNKKFAGANVCFRRQRCKNG